MLEFSDSFKPLLFKYFESKSCFYREFLGLMAHYCHPVDTVCWSVSLWNPCTAELEDNLRLHLSTPLSLFSAAYTSPGQGGNSLSRKSRHSSP